MAWHLHVTARLLYRLALVSLGESCMLTAESTFGLSPRISFWGLGCSVFAGPGRAHVSRGEEHEDSGGAQGSQFAAFKQSEGCKCGVSTRRGEWGDQEGAYI